MLVVNNSSQTTQRTPTKSALFRHVGLRKLPIGHVFLGQATPSIAPPPLSIPQPKMPHPARGHPAERKPWLLSIRRNYGNEQQGRWSARATNMVLARELRAANGTREWESSAVRVCSPAIRCLCVLYDDDCCYYRVLTGMFPRFIYSPSSASDMGLPCVKGCR